MRSMLAQRLVSNPARTLVSTLVIAMAMACGSDGGFAGPIPDLPDDPGNPDQPGPGPGPTPAGYAIYAVDLDNRLLVFGSADLNVTRRKTITGLPLLSRIVGIDFHPTNKKLYGVGNDSRVYVIDTLSGVATAVSNTKFAPAISQFFETHFGMGFEPSTGRIRLIGTEFGSNWSIDVTTGIATSGKTPRYADGPRAGRTLKINGLAYRPPNLGAAMALRVQRAAARIAAGSGLCDDLMYAINAEFAEVMGSCDPDSGDFTSIGPIPGVTAEAGCGELTFDNGPGNLWKTMQEGAQKLNRMGTVDPETGWVTWHGNVDNDSPIQGMAFEPGGLYGPSPSISPAISPARRVQARASANVTSAELGGLPSCLGA